MSPQDKANLKKQKSETRKQWVELIFSVLVLGLLLFFGYTRLFLSPHLGFNINLTSGMITSIEEPAEGYLQVDDLVVSINGIPPARTIDSIQSNPFVQAEVGDLIHITLIWRR